MIKGIYKQKYHILGFILVYFGLRFFSYFFQPQHFVNTFIAIIIVLITAYLLYKRNDYGWYIICSEFILGGVGSFLSIDFLSLRTTLLIVSILMFLVNKIRDKHINSIYINNKAVCHIFIAIYAIVGISFLRGYNFGNDFKLMISDAIPYLFLLYYFPLKELYLNKKFKTFILNILISAIIANLIFVLFTFIMYSAEFFVLQDSYYKFFRDIAGGKITDLSNNFFRVALDEHLLIVPLLIFFIYQSIQKKELLYKISAICLLIILSINLSRIYILAFVISLLLIFSLKYWKKYLIYSITAILILIISFSSIHFLASGKKSMGWELFGYRIKSIASPQIEQSSLSRMLLLQKIVEKIKEKPLFGHGLGSTVLVHSPILNKNIVTSQFDWGYLEITAELGIIGLLIWFLFLMEVSKGINLIKSLKDVTIKPYLGMFASLFVLSITAPAFFHVLGVTLLIVLLARNNTISSNSAGGVIINDKNQMVLVKQNSHKSFPQSWCYPKGHREKGESLKNTAIREIHEESGITNPKYIKELGEYSRYLGSNRQSGELKNIHMFLFKSNQEELKPSDPHNPEAKWFDMDIAREKMSYTEDKEFFDRVKNII